MAKLSLSDAKAEFRSVCADMRKADKEKAPMPVCLALGSRLGELMGMLMNDYGLSRDELLEIGGRGAVD